MLDIDQPPKGEWPGTIIQQHLTKPEQILPAITNAFDLPIEILIEILTLASHVQDLDQLAQYVARKTIFPFTALDVCQRWRTVAHDTPSMWTCATIIPDPEWYLRLMEHSTNCGSLPIHLDVMISQKQDIYAFEELLAKLLDVDYDTHVRSVRVIGTPEDGSFHISTINMIGRYFSVGSRIRHLELALRNCSSSWGEISLACLTPVLHIGIAIAASRCSHLRSLTLSSFHLPPWDTQMGAYFTSSLSCLDELYLKGCDAHTPPLLWRWEMPMLRTLVIDCISPPTGSVPTPLQRALQISPEWLYLPSVRNVVLGNVTIHPDLQILLSSVPNATCLALTSPPGDYPDLILLTHHTLPHPTNNRMDSVTQLTILDTDFDTSKLCTFANAKLP
ncbi:hypothetical protein FRB95_001088, partial [Tulasnella sp. JGI-2019a]